MRLTPSSLLNHAQYNATSESVTASVPPSVFASKGFSGLFTLLLYPSAPTPTPEPSFPTQKESRDILPQLAPIPEGPMNFTGTFAAPPSSAKAIQRQEGPDTSVVIGGVIGGVALVILVLSALAYLRHRTRQRLYRKGYIYNEASWHDAPVVDQQSWHDAPVVDHPGLLFGTGLANPDAAGAGPLVASASVGLVLASPRDAEAFGLLHSSRFNNSLLVSRLYDSSASAFSTPRSDGIYVLPGRADATFLSSSLVSSSVSNVESNEEEHLPPAPWRAAPAFLELDAPRDVASRLPKTSLDRSVIFERQDTMGMMEPDVRNPPISPTLLISCPSSDFLSQESKQPSDANASIASRLEAFYLLIPLPPNETRLRCEGGSPGW